MITINEFQCGQNSAPASFGRIGNLFSPDADLPELLQVPTLTEIKTAIATRKDCFSEKNARRQLAHDVVEDHRARNAPPATRTAAEKLEDENTYLVITGQQPGLLLGPLYTLSKCLQTIQLARQLTGQGYGTVLPAFWNASEDHDHSEIDHAIWLDDERSPVRFQIDLYGISSDTSVSAIPKERGCFDNLTSTLRQTLTRQPYAESVIEWIATSYNQADHSLADWFDHLLWNLVPDSGLLIFRPESMFLRRAAIPLLEKEIASPTQSSAEVNQAGEELNKLGFPLQVHKSESRTSFFIIEQGRRLPVHWTQDGFVLPDGSAHSQSDLTTRLNDRPEHFSPTAILRPVIQDAALPTIATIAGPNEALYHLQLRRVYERHTLARPALVPRSGATFIEPADRKILDKTGLPPREWEQETKPLVRKVVRSWTTDEFTQLREQLEYRIKQTYDQYAELGVEIDPTLAGPLEKQRNRLIRIVTQTEDLLVRRRAEREEILYRQIERLKNSLFPLGHPQERSMSIVHYLARYGFEFSHLLSAQFEAMEPGTYRYLEIGVSGS